MTSSKSTAHSARRLFSPALPGVLLLAALCIMVAGVALAGEEVQRNYGMISIGKDIFGSYCTSCHGREARGDGPLAESLKVGPADLTLISHRNDGEFPFEMVTKRIDGREKVRGHGSSDMPVWGKIFHEVEGGSADREVSQKVTALTHYLRSLQAAAETATTE